MTGLRFEHYDWKRGREAMLRFGPESIGPNTGPIVIAALPLFEEANRTRHFLVTILRALAVRGIASVLPDFPGTGESVLATHASRLRDQREAYAALTRRLGPRTYAVAIRSGAPLDADAPLAGRWYLAPQTGPDLIRDLDRIRAAASTPAKVPAEYAGNLLSADMLADLGDAAPAKPARIVRLATDPRAADVTYPGAPLWRRAEPGTDPELAQILAADIATWIAACER